MGKGIRIARVLLAIIAGEAALVLLTSVAQEVLFNGIDFYTSGRLDIILGGLATILAAVMAGAIAAVIPEDRNHIPPLVISVIILLETSYLISTGILPGPFWFDVLSGLSLVAGIWLGYFIIQQSGFQKVHNPD